MTIVAESLVSLAARLRDRDCIKNPFDSMALAQQISALVGSQAEGPTTPQLSPREAAPPSDSC